MDTDLTSVELKHNVLKIKDLKRKDLKSKELIEASCANHTVLFENAHANVMCDQQLTDMPILLIAHKNCQAKVSLYGGQVLSFQPNHQKDVLWLSDTAFFEQGKAIRGGIPLCWPWFGPNDKQDAKQMASAPAQNHGFARQVSWQVAGIAATEDALTLTLTFSSKNQHALWPAAFKLTQTLVFSTQFTQHLAMTNLSSEMVEYTGALHSYFRVSDPHNVTVAQLNEVKFDDKLTGEQQTKQVLTHVAGPLDRVYHFTGDVSLVDSQWQRRIDIRSNTAQWVLWNPGKTLADSMTDIHQNGEQEYVCLEAANTQWQRIAAGETVIMSQEIHIASLN